MIIGDTLWGILLCGLIAILCAIFIHRRRKIDKYVEEDAEECSVNSEIDYVKIYKELGYNGVLIISCGEKTHCFSCGMIAANILKISRCIS